MTNFKNELNTSITRLKQIEQEKLIKETQTKEEYKSLMEIEEKVKKDEDRKRKMEEELNTLRSNLQRENGNKDSMSKELQEIQAQCEDLMKTLSDKDLEREKILEVIKQLKKNMGTMKVEYNTKNEQKLSFERGRFDLEAEIKELQMKRTSLQLEISQAQKQCNKLANKRQQLIQQHDNATR